MGGIGQWAAREASNRTKTKHEEDILLGVKDDLEGPPELHGQKGSDIDMEDGEEDEGDDGDGTVGISDRGVGNA